MSFSFRGEINVGRQKPNARRFADEAIATQL